MCMRAGALWLGRSQARWGHCAVGCCCWHHDCDYDRDYYDHSDAQLELSGTVAFVRDGPGWTWLLAMLTGGRWEWVAGVINPRSPTY